MKRELSQIIREEIKDPRLPEFVSVTGVQVTRDLKYAKIYVSVLGDEDKKQGAIAALTRASGFIRHEIGQRIKLRYTPELHFRLDESIEHGIQLSKLIDETMGRARTNSDASADGRDDG